MLQLLKTSVGGTWALRQMRELVQSGLEVHATMPDDGPLLPEYRAAGVTVHPVQLDFPTRRPWEIPRRLSSMRELVREVRPDLIHSHFVGTTLTMRLALGRRHAVPRVFQVPGPLHLESGFFRRAEIASAGPPDYWIGSCRWTCDRYRRSGVDRDRVFLSYYGTDLGVYRAHAPGKLRAELKLPSSAKIVGMVAYMYAPKRYLGQTRGLKGHEDLIDAIAIARRRNPDVEGVFIGGAWNHANRYEARIRAYGRTQLGEHVHFLGTRSDVPELYADFDVAVHPSHSENVGGAIESLMLGVPTIASGVGGFPDLVIPGETGWLVPPKSPARLAATILDALNDPEEAERLAGNGRTRARDLFDVSRTAREVAEIYLRILAQAGSASGGNR